MFRSTKRLASLALFMMVFQFFAPAFIPSVAREIPTEKATAYHAHHNSIVAPTLMKEQDEKEHADFHPLSSSTALLDLTRHSTNLVASHKIKYSQFSLAPEFLQPPRTVRLCTFII